MERVAHGFVLQEETIQLALDVFGFLGVFLLQAHEGRVLQAVLQLAQFPLARHHLIVVMSDLVDKPRHGEAVEAQAADLAAHAGPRLEDFVIDLPLLGQWFAAYLQRQEFLETLLVAQQLLELVMHVLCGRGVLGILVLVHLVGKTYHLADLAGVVLQHLADVDEQARRQPAAGEGAHDATDAHFDALGDLHLVLTLEERHSAHLFEIHADGVVELVAVRPIDVDVQVLVQLGRPFGEGKILVHRLFAGGQGFILGRADTNPKAAEHRHDRFHIERRRGRIGEEGVELVDEDVPAGLA